MQGTGFRLWTMSKMAPTALLLSLVSTVWASMRPAQPQTGHCVGGMQKLGSHCEEGKYWCVQDCFIIKVKHLDMRMVGPLPWDDEKGNTSKTKVSSGLRQPGIPYKKVSLISTHYRTTLTWKFPPRAGAIGTAKLEPLARPPAAYWNLVKAAFTNLHCSVPSPFSPSLPILLSFGFRQSVLCVGVCVFLYVLLLIPPISGITWHRSFSDWLMG